MERTHLIDLDRIEGMFEQLKDYINDGDLALVPIKHVLANLIIDPNSPPQNELENMIHQFFAEFNSLSYGCEMAI